MIAGRAAGYALFGLAALLLAVALWSAWSGAGHLRLREDAGEAAAAAAAEFVAVAGRFDEGSAPAYIARVRPLTGGGLREALVDAAVAPARGEQRALFTTVESTAVTALDGAAATVVVMARQERRWLDPWSRETQQQVERRRITCQLTREGDGWLVVDLHVESPIESPVESGEHARLEGVR